MLEIRSSNPPVVTGICDPNKSRARHHCSFKLGSKLKCLNIILILFLVLHYSCSLNGCSLDGWFSDSCFLDVAIEDRFLNCLFWWLWSNQIIDGHFADFWQVKIDDHFATLSTSQFLGETGCLIYILGFFSMLLPLHPGLSDLWRSPPDLS